MAEPQPPFPGADRIRSLTDQDSIFRAFDAYPWTKDSAFLVSMFLPRLLNPSCSSQPTCKYICNSYTHPHIYGSYTYPSASHLHPTLIHHSPASAPSSAPQTHPTPKTAPCVTSPPTPASSTTHSASASKSTSPPTRPGSLSTQNTRLRTSSPQSTNSSSRRNCHRYLLLPPQHGRKPPPRPTSTLTVVPRLRLLARAANHRILWLSQR